MKKKSRIIVSSRLKPSLWRACAAVLAGLGGAHADSFYWSGDASLFWNAPVSGLNGTNWSSSPDFNNPTIGAGALPGSNDDVFFNLFDATNLATTLGAEFSIRSLAFTPDATNPVSIGGTHALTIGLGGITDNSPAAITLSAPVVLGSSQTWTNQSSNAFTVSGNVSGAASSNLTLAGSGIFNLTGANSYAGSTTLFTGSMTLSGAGTLAGTSGVTLNAGTTLLLDNTTANVSDRLANTVTITSRGGTVALLGNGATPTVENIGMLTVGSGASTIRVSGATLGLGAAGTLPGLARLRGGTVVFQPTAGGSIITPNTALSNGIIGGWALTSNGTGNGVDWATTGNLGAVVPFTDYQPFSAGSLPEENAKFDASVTGSVAITSNLSVNSLYLTGASTPVSDVSGTPASYIANGTGSATPVRAYYNGITFGTGSGAGSTVVLTIGSGGIISSGATGVGYYNNKANVENMAFIGYLFDESGGSTGRITSGNGSDLIVYTESNLRIAANIVNNGATPIGLTKSGPGILDLSNGNNQNNKAGNSFSGKVVINEGILTISREDQLGTSNSGGYVADAITFNGGELLTYAGTNFAASRGFTVGTRGGVVAYTGGGNTLVQAKITGPGGFSLYSRQTGGGGGQTMRFAIPTVGGVAASDYQGSTNLWLGYADGGTGAGGSSTGVLRFDLPNQLPATSAVNANMVDDTR
ncbi:MAG: hypothetical protein V4710_11890, partial [Verrucomicrobiota bacterium]